MASHLLPASPFRAARRSMRGHLLAAGLLASALSLPSAAAPEAVVAAYRDANGAALAALTYTAPADPGLDARSLVNALTSRSVMVYDAETGEALFAKNADQAAPIASITKLMTAAVVLSSGINLQQRVAITSDDVDRLKNSGSRVSVGSVFTRDELLHLALIASDNRAAHALARTFPKGGKPEFVRRMNSLARDLGLRHTRFVEPTGLSSQNRSTAEELAVMADKLGERYPEIREISAQRHFEAATKVTLKKKRGRSRAVIRQVGFNNTNRLVRDGNWDIGLSKTGYIKEAGYCLVMRATVAGRDTVLVLLDAAGSYARARDAQLIRRWLESGRAV